MNNRLALSILFVALSLVAWAQQDDCFMLKVKAAESAGLDTTYVFREQQATYYRDLLRSYMVDSAILKNNVVGQKGTYPSFNISKVLVEQIFVALPQNMTNRALNQAKQQMDSIYSVLRIGTADFTSCVSRFSSIKGKNWYTSLQTPIEWENIVAQLKIDSISSPFLTPQGLYIVKLLDRMEYNISMKDFSLEKIDMRSLRGEVNEWIRKSLAINQSAVDELLVKGGTTHVLFTLGDKTYTGVDFAYFARSFPASLPRQYEYFLLKSLSDYKASLLENRNSDFCAQLSEYRNNCLVDLITDKEVIQPSLSDETALQTYFEQHRSSYDWEKPRHKGVVLRCTTKRIAKKARKFFKNIPEKEWSDAIRLVLNKSDSNEVLAEIGVFATQDIPYTSTHPVVVMVGKKIKGPEHYSDIRERVLADYQSYLKRQWEARLKELYRQENGQ